MTFVRCCCCCRCRCCCCCCCCCYNVRVLVFISTIIGVASKSIFKMYILKMLYWLLESHTDEWITNWCGKLKLDLSRLQQYFNTLPPPPHPPTMYNHQAEFGFRYLRARVKPCSNQVSVHAHPSCTRTVQFCIFLKLYSPMSDLLAHYDRQTQVWHFWSTVAFEHWPLNQNSSKQKLQKNNRSTRVTCLALPVQHK